MPAFKAENLLGHMAKAKEKIRRQAVRGTATGYECRMCSCSWDVGADEDHEPKCIAQIEQEDDE